MPIVHRHIVTSQSKKYLHTVIHVIKVIYTYYLYYVIGPKFKSYDFIMVPHELRVSAFTITETYDLQSKTAISAVLSQSYLELLSK